MADVTACTIVAANYLPAARVLAASYLEHHPGHRFVIGVVDADWTTADDDGSPEILGPARFGIDRADYLRMATAYSVTEMATAVKPYLLRELRADSPVVIYLDPDIRVFAPMPELAELATAHGIVLTPHFLEPLPRDGREPTEAMIMGAGIFNLGFVATGPGSEPFLDFWAERLRHDAIVAPDRQLFTDQRWVDQVPALFGNHVLRDPGFNVAYWNAHERPVTVEDGVPLAGGHRLRFFHFSGYRPEKPWLLSHHTPLRPRVRLSDSAALRALCDEYAALLREAGYGETLEAIGYGFAALPDGTKLTPTMRRMFRAAWISAEKKGKALPPAAFGETAEAFVKWLGEPADDQPANSVSRLAAGVWSARADLRAAFPQPFGRDAEAFRTWCRTSGRVEENLPDWAVPAEQAPPAPPVDALGVNVLGYLTAELGVGEMGRIVHDAIRAAEVPVAAVVEDRLVLNRTGLDTPETAGAPRFPVSLLCVNADQTQPVLAAHPEVGHQRYRIGLWAWELDHFPAELHQAFDLVDEVWTISEFCRSAIAAHSPVPVHVIPVPIRDPGPRPVRDGGGPTTFLFAFDYYSIAKRKNPYAVVEAFRRAFPDDSDVRLVIKTLNAEDHPDPAERLRVLAAADPRIEVVDRYLSVEELHEMYASADCYVSLHRSEGFGLTVAEAMVRGLPVIATDYSGTAEFLTPGTGWPIPWTAVAVGKEAGPYPPSARWAEPDVDAAAAAMRAVADDPAEAARRGAAAREHILRTRSMDAAAAWMRTRLTAAHRQWRERQSGPRPVDGDPLTPLRDARQALLWRPDANTSSRLPLAPALRKAVLRAIDHYDVHQRAVLGELMGGIESTVSALHARLARTEAELAAAQATSARADQAIAEIAELRSVVAGLVEQNPKTRAALGALSADVAAIGEAVERHDRRTHEMFAERDVRYDGAEARLVVREREVGALLEAARARFAPIPAGTDVVVCDAGALLVPHDAVVRPWLVHNRSWESAEGKLLASLAGRGVFLDIGAHVGYHTLRVLGHGEGVAGAIAVEANPGTAELLRRNIAANTDPALVTVLACAAWDTTGEAVLVHAEAGNSGDHRVRADGEGVRVPAVRLDEVPAVRDAEIGLVKVDLQGRDHRALAGLADVLRRDRPDVLCEYCPEAIEELGDDPIEVLAGYRALGFRPVVVDETGLGQVAVRGDADLVALAREAESGFVTLWLRPVST
ncbi:FkbM family methyltransferase [Actinokineospora sp. NPDC004072]